jgi:hypothetical protein
LAVKTCLFQVVFDLLLGHSGLGLFLLARKLMPLMGAFAVLAFYLFTPQAAIYSRNFQPDPLMVMLIAWALYFQYLWWEKDTTRNAILAGLFTGLAILVKAPAVFFVGFPIAGLVLHKVSKISQELARLSHRCPCAAAASDFLCPQRYDWRKFRLHLWRTLVPQSFHQPKMVS